MKIRVPYYSKYGDGFPTKFKDVTENLVPAGRRIMVQGDKIVNVAACDFCGWCYTQLTLAEQETNGLLNGKHQPKFDVEKNGAIVEKYGKNFY